MKRILLAMASLVVLWGCSRKEGPAPAIAREVRLVAADGGGRDLSLAASVLRARLADVRGAKVETRGDALVVGLPALDSAREAAVLRRLTRRGVLAFAPVVDRSATVRALASGTPGVTTTPDGAIEGSDKTALLAAVKTAAPLAQGEMAALEPFFGAWRVWIVDRSRALEPDVVKVHAAKDEGGAWSVRVTMSEESGALFAELTRSLIGEKLAILYDDEVRSTPIVLEPVTGSEAWITTRGEDDARELAAVLAHDPLPFALVASE